MGFSSAQLFLPNVIGHMSFPSFSCILVQFAIICYFPAHLTGDITLRKQFSSNMRHWSNPQHWAFLCHWRNVTLITLCRKILLSIDQVGSLDWVWSEAKRSKSNDSKVVTFWAQMSALNFKLSIKYVWKLCQTDRNRHARKFY